MDLELDFNVELDLDMDDMAGFVEWREWIALGAWQGAQAGFSAQKG